MTPAQLDLPPIWRGGDWLVVTFTWKDQAGNPIDLTGWTPFVRSRNIDLNPQVTDAVGGVVTLSLTHDDTDNLRVGVEKWDWLWQDPNGVVYPPFFKGEIEIKQGITSAPQLVPIPG